MPGAEQATKTWNDTPEPDEIDLREYIAVLWRRRWLILAVVVAALAVAAAVSFAMPRVFRMETVLALAQVQGGFYGNQSVASEVLLSEDFLRDAVGRAGLPQDRAYLDPLRRGLKVEPVQGSNLIRIVLETSDPGAAKALLQSMADLYAQKSEEELAAQKDLLHQQLAAVEKWQADLDHGIDQARQLLASSIGAGGIEARFERAVVLTTMQGQEQLRLALIDRYLSLKRELASIKGVRVIQQPEVPARPVRPRPALNLAVAAVLGLMLSVLAAFAWEYFGRTVPDAS
ncbi:MAG: Wzz/FepE/Etk N-terminal domain-containing protein [Moorellales bacterium]